MLKGYRRLQIDILTLFLTLLTVVILCIVSYMYYRNSKSILQFAKGTAERTGRIIEEKVDCLTFDLQQLPQLTSGFFAKQKDVNVSNPLLKDFLFSAIKAYPHLHAFFVGFEDGSFLEAVDLKLLQRGYYLADTSKVLPPETAYAFRVIDHTKEPPTETWSYLNASFETLTEEKLQAVEFDPRKRPWYMGAKEHRGIFWSDAYIYDPVCAKGISVAAPLLNQNGVMIGAVGADLPLSVLEKFLDAQKSGKHSKSFIFNNLGKLIVPEKDDTELQDVAEEAYSIFSSRGERNFVFEYKGVEYLGYVHRFPAHFLHDWQFVLVTPLSDFFGGLLRTQKNILYISLLILLLSALLVYYFSKRISAPIVTLSQEVDKIRQLDLEGDVAVKSRIYEISMLESSLRSTKVMLRSFGRYIPKPIVKQLMQKGQEIAIGGEKKEITIFFSDIAGFTPIAESMEAEHLMTLLEQYFDRVSKVILECGGTIDKYIGDAVMAFWGAPMEVNDHAVLGCQAALKCQVAIKKLNEQRVIEGEPEFPTRIGVNSGVVIVGNIGTKERMNYTAIGDAVNIASRLEQTDKVYHTSIILGEEVVKRIGDRFLVRPLDITPVKGKKEKIKIYELMGEIEGEVEILATVEQKEFAKNFSEGFEAYHLGDREKARQIFQKIAEKYPTDYPTKIYLERLT